MKNKSMTTLVAVLFIFISLAPMLLPEVSALRFSSLNLKNADGSVFGVAWADGLGNSLDIVGDINGDGFDDFIIDAPYNDQNGGEAGKIYVFFGKASGWSMDVNASKADASYLGESGGDQAGYTVAGLGDVNGDGFDDFAVHSEYEKFNQGKVYLIFGRSSPWSVNVSLSNANASFIGQSSQDYTGKVAPAGDVNKDGYQDLLISTNTRYYKGVYGGGKVYLVFGRKAGWTKDTPIIKANASYLPDRGGESLGYSTSGVGDVNGDGYDDIALGATGNNTTGAGCGKLYIIFGKASGWANNVSITGSNASYIGESTTDQLGWSVSGGGDFNGDGLDDIVVSAYGRDENNSNAGQTYLIFGKESGWSNNVSISNADASFIGRSSTSYTGRWVNSPGDLNGDGYDDVLIASSSIGNVGETYIILGKSSGWIMDKNLSNPDAKVVGEKNGDYSGHLGRYKGDLNRDGYNEILVGAPSATAIYQFAGKAYVVFPERASPPSAVASIKAYGDAGCNNEIGTASASQKIYLEIVGTDGNSTRADTTVVNVKSSSTDTRGIQVVLRETGINTGKYRGYFSTAPFSDQEKKFIGVSNGQEVVATSLTDTSKNVSIDITDTIILKPLTDLKDVQEDANYNSHYWTAFGTATSWGFTTNATWLTWNATAHNITGTPVNKDVGSYWVKLNITDGNGHYDEHNFTLTVHNVAPKILTTDNKTVQEDTAYSVTYSSDDDPSTTWSCNKNATWLNFSPSTLVLNGTPLEKDVGSYWVNLSVNDGKGGKASTNFTLNVTNRDPTITGSDIITILEDVAYSNDYGSDDDPDTTYSITTSADFLSIGGSTGVLSGTPNNSDVGDWLVNLTVKDKHSGLTKHNFTLDVTNVPPIITTGDITSVLEDTNITNDYNSTDDPWTTWSIDTNASGVTFNAATGDLFWDPDNGNVGQSYMNISVDDGHGGNDFHNFTFNVVNRPPILTTGDLLFATEDKPYSVDYNSTDDADSVASYIKWSLKTNASWLSIDPISGVLSGTPTNAEVGKYQVNVSISDNNGGMAFSNFILTVLNAPPKILTSTIPSVDEDSEYFAHYNSDDDNSGTVTWGLETNADWLKLDPKEGIINGTPDNSEVGKYDVKVTADDGHGGTDIRIFVLSVINTPPMITTVPATGVTQDQQYLVDFDSTDDGLGIIYWTMPKGPTWLTMDPDTGVLKGTPGNSDVGQYQMIVSVSDGNGGTSNKEYTLTVLNVDDPAMWTRVPTDTILNKGVAYSFDVDAIEPDTGATPVFSISSSPASSITINAKTGVIDWVPTEYGKYTITISFGDMANSIYHNFIITVNTPPMVSLASPLNGTEVDVINPTFQWSAIDGDEDNVTSNLYYGTDEAGVRALGTQYLKGIGLKDTYYIPVVFLEKGKKYYWTVIPDDGRIRGNCASGVWSFSVNANATENAPPRFTSTPDPQTKVGFKWTYGPTASDDDPKDQVTITLVSGPEGMTFVTGVLNWIPRDDQIGIYKVKLQASDGKSAIYQEFSITVSKISSVNHPPVIDMVSPIKVQEGGTISIKVTATDTDGDAVSFELVSGPQGLSINEYGQLVWATKKGDAGNYDVVVRASDGKAVDNTTLKIKVEKVGGTNNNAGFVTILAVLLVVIMIIVAVVLIAVLRTRKERATSKELAVEAAPPKSTTKAAAMHKAVPTEGGQKVQTDKKIAIKTVPVKEKGTVPEKKLPDVPAKGTPMVTQQKVAVIEAVDLEDLENE